MKSNQLNAIALLLLTIAGISAEGETTVKPSWFATAKSYLPTMPSMETVKGYMPEATYKNAGIGVATVIAVPAVAYVANKAYTKCKNFFTNEAVVLASSDKVTDETIEAFDKIIEEKGYDKDAFSTVRSNLLSAKNGQKMSDARINNDNACYTGHKLQWALRKCYYNPVKTAAIILGSAAAGYAVHHYGVDTAAINGLNNGASWMYSKLPAMPALFAKKTTEPVPAQQLVRPLVKDSAKTIRESKAALNHANKILSKKQVLTPAEQDSLRI